MNPKRLAAFKERSRSLAQDPDMPPFLYGSHYSSAAAVVFFLLRLEPFTRHAWDLQDGRFDHADRLFHSVAEAWRNCQESTSDVKELTPEFYYLPDFLVNGNAYPLGARQDGTELGDVCLPPWARGSPDAFVRRMREALESEHVSLRLHDWVDLVFGQKQRGSLAEAADNTFFHTTYEGSVDLGAVADPGLRQALADQVRHFGQTPSQLFDARRPHPARRLPRPVVGLGATGVFVPADVRAGLALEAAAKGLVVNRRPQLPPSRSPATAPWSLCAPTASCSASAGRRAGTRAAASGWPPARPGPTAPVWKKCCRARRRCRYLSRGCQTSVTALELILLTSN